MLQHLIGGRNEGDVVVYPILSKSRFTRTRIMQRITRSSTKCTKRIHPETFSRTMTTTCNHIHCRVLAMFDQQWNFGSAESVLVSEGKYERTYVPLGISLTETRLFHTRYKDAGIIGGNGMGISVKCKDVERALNSSISCSMKISRSSATGYRRRRLLC